MFDFLCVVPLLSSLLAACDPAKPLAVGYVEGEYVLIAPVETAQVVSVAVRRGDSIAAGQALVQLQQRDAEIAVAEAEAAAAQARNQLADLRQGKRPEEIAVVEAALASASAQAQEAERVLSRQTRLLQGGTTTQGEFDRAATNVELANAKLAELKADLAVARLPARAEAIKAAEAALARAEAVLDNARWRLGQRTLSSLKPGTVFDIIRNPGEIAGPQAPVVSVLPQGAIKLRLYVPASSLADVAPGTRLRVRCDGCDDGLSATVSYVASDPEFTPPVLYSPDSRQKLVYLIEARPDANAARLQPGQIVDVDLGAGQ